jgi:hypothetical protein
MRFLLAAALLTGAAYAAPEHHCASDAREKAAALLRLHFEGPESFVGDRSDMERPTWSIDSEVTVLPPIRALKGKGKLDVVQVLGFIYRATYRMRFIYAHIDSSCVLIGQEILEESDPY